MRRHNTIPSPLGSVESMKMSERLGDVELQLWALFAILVAIIITVLNCRW